MCGRPFPGRLPCHCRNACERPTKPERRVDPVGIPPAVIAAKYVSLFKVPRIPSQAALCAALEDSLAPVLRPPAAACRLHVPGGGPGFPGPCYGGPSPLCVSFPPAAKAAGPRFRGLPGGLALRSIRILTGNTRFVERFCAIFSGIVTRGPACRIGLRCRARLPAFPRALGPPRAPGLYPCIPSGLLTRPRPTQPEPSAFPAGTPPRPPVCFPARIVLGGL